MGTKIAAENCSIVGTEKDLGERQREEYASSAATQTSLIIGTKIPNDTSGT